MIKRHTRAALTVAISMSLFLPNPDLTNAAKTVRCSLTNYGALQACYRGQDVAQAERQLPVPPVNPSAAVWSASHLQLSSVIIQRLSHQPATVVGIVYIYGTIPASGGDMIPLPAPPRPQFVVVSEPAPFRPSGPWRVARTIGHFPNGKLRYDPWNFYARNLDVVGNVSKQSIRQIGLHILARKPLSTVTRTHSIQSVTVIGGEYTVILSAPQAAYPRGADVPIVARIHKGSSTPTLLRWACHRFAQLHVVTNRGMDLGPVPLVWGERACRPIDGAIGTLRPHTAWTITLHIRLLRTHVAAQITGVVHKVDRPGYVDEPFFTRPLTFAFTPGPGK